MADKPDQPDQGAQPQSDRPRGAPAPLAAVASTLGAAGMLGGFAVFAVTGVFSRWAWIPIAAGAGLFLLSVALSPRDLLAVLRRRRARMGMNMAAVMLFVTAIAVLVNYVAARRHHRFDFTKSKRHSVSLQTRKILKGLKQDVTMVASYSHRSRFSQFEEMASLLDEYRYGSKHIKARMIDPDRKPGEAQRYRITSPSVTVVEAGDRRQEVYGPNEQDLTGAILKVTREKKQKIYFLIGHGEHDPSSPGRESYSAAKRALEDLQYEVATLNLITQEAVPKDCAVLVVAGPQKPLAGRELEAIGAYLDGGGKALILVDPAPQPSLAGILARWGIRPQAGTVVEPMLNIFGDANTVVVTKPGYHEITKPFTEARTLGLQFVTPRAFERDPAAGPQLRVAEIVKTSEQSWLETTFTGQVDKDPTEKGGPLTIAMAVSSGPPPPPPGMPQPPPDDEERNHLVVIGDSDFAVDAYFGRTGNGDLFLNAVSWLAEEPELIAIKPKPREEHSILLDTVQGRKVRLLLFAVPLAVLAAGGYVWWRRR